MYQLKYFPSNSIMTIKTFMMDSSQLKLLPMLLCILAHLNGSHVSACDVSIDLYEGSLAHPSFSLSHVSNHNLTETHPTE